MDNFEDVRILDNFYQTSSFFPMPVVLVSTISENGETNLGPYSLCFPHIIAGQGQFAMMLIARADSNTAVNIRRTGTCALNFIPDDKKFMENCVMLGFPGETTEEKMKNSIFNLMPSTRDNGNGSHPDLVEESIQIFECTWQDTYPCTLIEGCSNFVLKVEKILMQKKFKEAIISGMESKRFPNLPIDYGFRDNTQFWFAETKKPYSVEIPKSKGVNVNTVMYAAQRYDPSVEWTEEACIKIANVPRIFLKRVFKGVVDQAKAEGVTVITAEFMDKVRDKRSDEKNN